MKLSNATRIGAVVALLALGTAACGGGGNDAEQFSPPDDFEMPELEERSDDTPEVDYDQRIHDLVEQGLGADIYPDN
jgi:hypothetical protein